MFSCMITTQKFDLQYPVGHASHNASGSIANTLSRIQVAQNHHWTAHLECELRERKARSIDAVEELHWIQNSLSLISSRTKGVCTVKDLGLSRKLGKNLLVDSVNIFIACSEQHPLREVGVWWIGKMFNARVNSLHQRVQGVLCTFEVLRQSDVAIIVSVFAITNIQLPLCKIALCRVLTRTHVDCELENGKLFPDHRALQTGTHNLRSGCFDNDRQSLSKISTKNNGETTKEFVGVANVLEGSVHCLYN